MSCMDSSVNQTSFLERTQVVYKTKVPFRTQCLKIYISYSFVLCSSDVQSPYLFLNVDVLR